MVGRLPVVATAALAVLGTVLAAEVGPSSHSAQAQTITPRCNLGSCAPWFARPVTLDWAYSPGETYTAPECNTETFRSDVRATRTCTVIWGNPGDSTEVRRSVEVKVDMTPPTVTSARPLRTPDLDGWYNHPVRFDFGGSDALSGVAGCESVEYAGPDGRAVAVNGSCSDVAGNVAQRPAFLDYDATAPAIRAVPDRPPDSNGWYTRPVGIAFEGADSVSGVRSCTSARYEGPDSGSATVAGSCTDGAGNTAAHDVPLLYDATRPSLELTRVLAAKRSATIEWSASSDVNQVVVSRSPGPESEAPVEVFSGAGTSFTDTRARRRIEYRYRVRVADPAGHSAVKTVAVVPGVGPVLRPGEDAGVAGPPLLRWRANPRSDYYNVQLYRLADPPAHGIAAVGAGRKIASSWPRSARLKLHRTWRFRGRKERLTPGHYAWYVWPGFGRKGARRYGALAGSGNFDVVH